MLRLMNLDGARCGSLERPTVHFFSLDIVFSISPYRYLFLSTHIAFIQYCHSLIRAVSLPVFTVVSFHPVLPAGVLHIQALMLRLIPHSTRSVLRSSSTRLPCLRSIHKSSAVQRGKKRLDPEGLTVKKKSPTFREVVNEDEVKRKRRARKAKTATPEVEVDTVSEDVQVATVTPNAAEPDITDAKPEEPEKKRSYYTKGGVPQRDPQKRPGFDKLSERQQGILKHLHKGYGGSSRRKAVGDIRRVNIVSEDLCGKIISQL